MKTIKECIKESVLRGVTLESYVREYMKTNMKINILTLPDNNISQLQQELNGYEAQEQPAKGEEVKH